MMEALDYYGSDKARMDLHYREKLQKLITSQTLDQSVTNTTLNSTSQNNNLSLNMSQFSGKDHRRNLSGNAKLQQTMIEGPDSQNSLNFTVIQSAQEKERNRSEFDVNHLMFNNSED